MGDREARLNQAIARLPDVGVVVGRISPYIETAPVGEGLDGAFLNAVLEARTELDPRQLLTVLLQLELEAGRDRSVGRNRTLDLDILLMGTEDGVWIRRSASPVLPHPRMWSRQFVTEPLAFVLPLWQDVQRLLAPTGGASTG